MNDDVDRIEQLMGLSKDLISFADMANGEARDDGCVCLFGLVKDCAYRIKVEAQREHLLHQARERRDKAAGL